MPVTRAKPIRAYLLSKPTDTAETMIVQDDNNQLMTFLN